MSETDMCQYCLRTGRLIAVSGHGPNCKYGQALERLRLEGVVGGIAEEILAGDAQIPLGKTGAAPYTPGKPTTDWPPGPGWVPDHDNMGMKPTNPKDAIGVLKYAMSYVSAPVLAEIAVGMTEGGHKYGRHNYRVIGVRASIYYDATMRHLMQWWEGEDLDPDSGLSHITKAITSLVVLRDAMIQGMFTDDRPPKTKGFGSPWYEDMNKRTKALDAKYPTKVPSYTEIKP